MTHSLNTIFLTFVAGALLFGCGSASSQAVRQTRLEDGQFPGAMAIPQQNKVTVVYFWSSYCEPCKPKLIELESLWKSVDRNRCAIIGVTADESRADALNLLEEIGQGSSPSYPMVLDADGTVQKEYGVISFPAVVVIDANGKVDWSTGGLTHPVERDVSNGAVVNRVAERVHELLKR